MKNVLKSIYLINDTKVGALDWEIGQEMFIYYADGKGIRVAPQGTFRMKGNIKSVKVDKDGYITSIRR